MTRKQIVGLFLGLIPLILAVGLVASLPLVIHVLTPVTVQGWTYEGLGGGSSVQQTSDGGYIVVGANLVRVDADGNKLWDKPISGSFVQQTLDGGYIVVGSNLIKTDAEGNTEWQQEVAGSRVQQTSDGGYIIIGSTLVKTDDEGNAQWEQPISGYWVQQTSDGGYTVIGSTIIKTDAEGNKWWERPSAGASGRQTSDGGFVFVGSTSFATPYGDESCGLLTKLDANGNKEWDNIIDARAIDDNDYLGSEWTAVEQASDGGYVVLAADHWERMEYWRWGNYWLAKTNSEGIELTTVGVGSWQSDQHGGSGNRPGAFQQTSDGGYVYCGRSFVHSYDGSFEDLLLVKMGPITGHAINQPSNVSPPDGATGVDLYPTLQASAFSDPDSEGHAASQWQMTATPGDYSSPVFDSGLVGGGTSFSFDAWSGQYDFLYHSTSYYWRVRYLNGSGALSPWSAETQFTTGECPPPGQPYNRSPEGGATLVSLTPTLESGWWDAVYPYRDSHAASQWQITATPGDFSSPVFYSGTDASNLTSITIPAGVLDYYTIYYWHVRHQGKYGGWSGWSPETSFTTVPAFPVVTTNAASSITTNSARLNGELVWLGTATSVTASFVWGTSSVSYTNETPGEVKTSPGAYYFDLSGLSPSTTYYYRTKVVTDSANYGDERSFRTLTTPPAVTTSAASGVGTSVARLNGNLTSLGTASAVQVCFEWGLTTSYGNTTAPQTLTGTGVFGANINGLVGNTRYHYRAKAVGHDTAYGQDMTFVTGAYHNWDINQDGKVDYKDLAMLGAHYGETPPPPYPAWDINGDGKVDYKDLAMLGAHYGEEY